MNDDLIFWNDIPVGCVEGNHIVWFSHAPREAIEAYAKCPLHLNTEIL